MPNHCENELEITGEVKTLDKLAIFIKSDKSDFDFNKIIAYPEEFAKADEEYAKLSDEEKMKIKDGFNSGGYEWCIENWGTKWSAYDLSVSEQTDRIVINFMSAWSPPCPIIAKLAELFPSLTFLYKYEEGGMDFSGFQKYENGKCTEEIEGRADDYPVTVYEEDNPEG
jgi:hypothetical protein